MANLLGLALGVDVGGTKILGVITNEQATLLYESRRPTFRGMQSDQGQRVAEESGESSFSRSRSVDFDVRGDGRVA